MGIFAYLDPGTGSLVLQVIIGAVVSVGVVIKAYGAKIRNFFGKKKKSAEKSESKTEE